MRINRVLLPAMLVLWLAACSMLQTPATEPAVFPPAGSPSQEPMKNPYAPQPTDSSLTRGEVSIKEMGVLVRESSPPQISLSLSGALPTPCHQLRLQVNDPDEGNKINVEAYSVVDPDMICTQVLEPFQASVDLGTFPSGHYSVWVNGELAGEFDS